MTTEQATDLHVGGGSLCLLLLLLVPSHHLVLFLVLVNGSVPQSREELLEYHVQTQDVLAEPHHATSADGGQGGIAKVLHLKHYANLHPEEGTKTKVKDTHSWSPATTLTHRTQQ